MWTVGAGEELGMELAGDHVGMIGKFGYFHQPAIRGDAGEEHAGFLEFLAVGIVELKAVTVALLHL